MKNQLPWVYLIFRYPITFELSAVIHACRNILLKLILVWSLDCTIMYLRERERERALV